MTDLKPVPPAEALAAFSEDYVAGRIAGLVVTVVFKDGRSSTHVVHSQEEATKEKLLRNIQVVHRSMSPYGHIRTRYEPGCTQLQMSVPRGSTRRDIDLWARLIETGHAAEPPLRIEFWTGEFVYASDDDQVGTFDYGVQVALYSEGRLQML